MQQVSRTLPGGLEALRRWRRGGLTLTAWIALAACLPACGARLESGGGLASLRARNAVEEGQWELARRYAAEAAEAAETSERSVEAAEFHRLAAEAWSRGPAQSLGRALEGWQAVLTADPQDEAALLAAALCQARLGNWEATTNLLERAPASRARDLLLVEALAVLAPEKARPLLEQAVAEDPDEGGFWALLARTCADLDDSDCTVTAAQRATRINPFDRRSYYLLGRFGREDVAAILDQLTILESRPGPTQPTSLERLRALELLLGLTSGRSPSTDRAEAELLIEAGLTARARAQLSTLLAQGLSDPSDTLQLAGLFERAGDLETASRLLTELETTATTASMRREVIHRLSRLDRAAAPRRALARLEASVSEDPDVARHHCMLGLLYLDTGRTELSEAHLQRAIALAPWKAECRLALATLLDDRGKRDQVVRLLAEAIDPESTSEFRSQHGY